eukprot:3727480-Ditylum_brightwellii.AAC.1
MVGNDNASDKDIGLALGGYESAFLADIVAYYLFKMTDAHFSEAITRSIYCDDGGTYLQFIMEVWNLLIQNMHQVGTRLETIMEGEDVMSEKEMEDGKTETIEDT